MMHDFAIDRDWGESVKDAPFWRAIYAIAIPNFANVLPNGEDNGAQRRGVDDVVLTTDGRSFRLQKKARRYAEEPSDILLEMSHRYSDGTSKPGWIDIANAPIDFFAYGWPNLSAPRAYVFPWQSLRAAWVANGAEWRARALESWNSKGRPKSGRGECVEGFYWVGAQNRSYVTHSVAVPIPLLLSAILDTMVITLNSEAAE